MVRFLLGASFSGWTLIRDLLSFLKDLSEAEATAPRPRPPVPQQKDGGGGGGAHYGIGFAFLLWKRVKTLIIF